MPTTKQRINLCVPHNLSIILKKLSRQENVPIATKALELLRTAIEIEEDILLDQIALERDQTKATFITHDEVWK